MIGKDQWVKYVAQAFINELPIEYIEHIISNPDYVIPVEKHCKAYHGAFGPMSSKRMTEIENLAIDLRNRHYTRMIREELVKIKKAKP